MQVYVLKLASPSDLNRAFDRVLGSPDVDSCVVEADERRVRFFAPTAPAEKLVERVYADGGLVSCSRHRVEAPPE